MFWIPCYILAGAIYRNKLQEKYHFDVAKSASLSGMRSRRRDFEDGFFSCLSGHKVLKRNCFVCWCAPARFAADASATGFMEFWLALIMTSIFLPILWVFGYIGRLHIREEYGMEAKPATDCCAWFWCYCCSLVQEAKFVDSQFRALANSTSNHTAVQV